MADDDTRWGVEAVSAAKLNALAFFAYANLAAFPATNMEIGAKGIAEDTGILYQNTGTYATPVWTDRIVSSDGLPYLKLSTTIGDYTQPSAAVATSEGTALQQITQDQSDSGFVLASGNKTRCGIKLEAGSVLIGSTLYAVEFWLDKNASPTGTATAVVRDSGDSIVFTLGTLDVSTLGSPAWVDFENLTGYTLQSGDRILLEYSGGDSTNRVDFMYEQLSNPYDGTNTVLTSYAGSYTDNSGMDCRFKLDLDAPALATYAVDDNVNTLWESDSEANPAIYVDLTSAREIVGIALNINKTATTVTSLKIRGSTDTTFSDGENIAYVNISDFTDDTWRYLANNFLETDVRYVQIYANETGVLSIIDIKVRYGVSDLLKILSHKHTTRDVSQADSFVDSD